MEKGTTVILKIPNQEMYSSHSFRRSSAILLVHAGGWKSTTVVERYIDDSTKNKTETEKYQVRYLSIKRLKNTNKVFAEIVNIIITMMLILLF